MPVMEKEYRTTQPHIPDDLEIAEYPPEVVERWDKIFEIAKLQIATGDEWPKTIEEVNAMLGITLDD